MSLVKMEMFFMCHCVFCTNFFEADLNFLLFCSCVFLFTFFHLQVESRLEKLPKMANWSILDEYSLYLIFYNLNFKDICNVSKVCKHWYYVSVDEFLWRNKFCQYFKLKNATLPPSSRSWKNEFKRLTFNIPDFSAKSEKLESPHCEEITNVCFSSDANFFATCGRDSIVVLWDAKGKFYQRTVWSK